MELEAVDVIDRKIIDQLRLDGRRSFGQIARYVGLSEGSVRQRYHRLLSLGVVQVVGMPNSPKMGYVEAHLSIRVRGATVETVARALAALPEVKYVGACIGSYDLSADVRCDDQAQMNAFLTDTVRSITGVDHLETAAVLEVIKDEYVWSGFREPIGRPTRPHPATGALPR
ncbi:Lrp/AsnC family transcriptional regulator [Herbiconiux sp. KACC 21604]|uniref:Lrp/AsnC family transcriptional regulator n=1 Tax=unclassified Herbiconiux TaxID=2618217 RepID=UPI001492C46F|nr:Lrp/AsnC family transcriptional regulator [Herbiconiux sp. SALV-R1]QJU55347.1 Lrp/AsnC family transcriptional regulator [Herbiconiux sp. SALV-R1]WPO86517.1 Lrp/AsnC family transcriptional regulator [Herbiconiux sp. KACC 21604]